MIVAVTGHRPEKIKSPRWVEDALGQSYKTLGVTTLIQGMAAGADLMSAKVAHDVGLEYICAKPWKGHSSRISDADYYTNVLHYAKAVVNVDPSESYPGAWAYQKRNEWMVDHADQIIAVWDGSKGGTYNCVKYAQKKGKPIYRLDPQKETMEWYA